MRRLGALLLVLIGACTAGSNALTARAVDEGIEIRTRVPIERVQVADDAGMPVVDQVHPAPVREAFVTTDLEPGRRYRVRVAGAEAWVQTDDPGLVEVALQAPMGGPIVPAPSGGSVGVPVVGEDAVRAAIHLTAQRPGEVSVSFGAATRTLRFDVAGQRRVLHESWPGEPVEVVVRAEAQTRRFTLVPRRRSSDEARDALDVVAVHLPTDVLGQVDGARPANRVTLPSRWWRRALRASQLGFRPRDDQAPWAWQAITLHNTGAETIPLLVRGAVVDDAGEPVFAFRPRLREAEGNTAVQALAQVPAGAEATVTLPLFVDGDDLDGHAQFTRRIEVIPMGADQPLHVVERPLYVSRGSPWASGWLVAALGASGLGWALLLGRGRRWIHAAPTSDLVTIALFGSVTWVAATALQVAGLGVASVLGPFAPLVTGLADDALRACLLGTLVALVPRTGTVALASVVGFVMRGLTLGTFHPVDLLYLGSAVFWLEGWLWISGCTRGSAWRDGSWVEFWGRLCVGLGLSNLCATATALVISVVFYRLYFAGWYVGLILALPGFLYVCLGCALAVGFARSLRQVAG